MANVTMTKFGTGTTGALSGSKFAKVETWEITLNMADALATKGSALASGDIIINCAVPAGTTILGGGYEIITAFNSTTATVDFGYTGAGKYFVDAQDCVGTTSGYGAVGSTGAATTPVRVTASKNLIVTLATMTGTLTLGTLRCYVIVAQGTAQR